MSETDLTKIGEKVLVLKEMAQDISGLSNDFPAVRRNIQRIMASIKMLEINTVDLIRNKQHTGIQ
jgi:hypothetical protein